MLKLWTRSEASTPKGVRHKRGVLYRYRRLATAGLGMVILVVFINKSPKSKIQQAETTIKVAVKEPPTVDECRGVIEAAAKDPPTVDECRNVTKATVKEPPTVDECRNSFVTKGQGGGGEIKKEEIARRCINTPSNVVFDVCQELQDFTGLTDDEFYKRMTRKGRFHFEGEHQFWNPTSKTELAWYYTTSVDYLFANAVHNVPTGEINLVANSDYEPVLDYSAGVGTNIIYLAKKGIKVQYFGIGMAEEKFAQYRVQKNGLWDLVEFKGAFSPDTGYKFDPINGPLPQDGSLGSILAMDVLEHIPNYQAVVNAMVKSLRVGGVIIENTPFARDEVKDGKDDIRVHLSNGGITMKEAMGEKMTSEGGGVWKKNAE